jgi:hypothetical protein
MPVRMRVTAIAATLPSADTADLHCTAQVSSWLVSMRTRVMTIAVALPLLAACASSSTSTAEDSSSALAIDSAGPISAVPTTSEPATAEPASAEPTTDADRKTLATQLADQLVGEVQLPTGAHPEPTAPAALLTQPPSTSRSPNEIDSVRWFTVSGTVDEVVAYAEAHPPKGYIADGTGSGGGPDHYSASTSFSGNATADYDAPTASVEATMAGSVVAVRVDAQVIWRPIRTAAEFVPQTVAGAIAVRSGAISATVQVTATQVPTLARLLDALQTQTPGERHCPPITYTTAITFDVSGPLVFTLNGCGGVTVTAAGVAQPTLTESDELATEVDALFGIIDSPAPASSTSS